MRDWKNSAPVADFTSVAVGTETLRFLYLRNLRYLVGSRKRVMFALRKVKRGFAHNLCLCNGTTTSMSSYDSIYVKISTLV